MKYRKGDLIMFPPNKYHDDERVVEILGVDKTGTAKGQYIMSDWEDHEQVAHWWREKRLNHLGASRVGDELCLEKELRHLRVGFWVMMGVILSLAYNLYKLM